jgi:hypothetical protein
MADEARRAYTELCWESKMEIPAQIKAVPMFRYCLTLLLYLFVTGSSVLFAQEARAPFWAA